MKHHKYALGLQEFLLHAILEHCRNAPDGARPRALMMHPAVWVELRAELPPLAVRPTRPGDALCFHGVRVVVSVDSQEVLMLTSCGRVESL